MGGGRRGGSTGVSCVVSMLLVLFGDHEAL
jgi:hypothetical protein